MFTEKLAPQNFVSLFWFGSDPKNYLSLCLDLIFFIHLGKHPSNTDEEYEYYHLYHEEA